MQHLQKLNKLDVLDAPMEQVKVPKELVTANKAETQQPKMTVSTLDNENKEEFTEGTMLDLHFGL